MDLISSEEDDCVDVRTISEVWKGKLWLTGEVFSLDELDALCIDAVVTVLHLDEGEYPIIGNRKRFVINIWDWESENIRVQRVVVLYMGVPHSSPSAFL